MGNETTWITEQVSGIWRVYRDAIIAESNEVAKCATEADARAIIADHAAASRLAELQEEVVKLRGVEAQAVEWFNKAEEGYRIVQALQKELDVARAETNEQRARADGWRDKFNADTDRIAGLEAENTTLTERAARLDEIVREALAEIDANPDWHVHGYAYLTLQALAATSPAVEKAT